MAELHIIIQYFRIAEGGLDLSVAEELLNLVNRHAALESERCCRMAEDVRGNMDAEIAAGNDLLNLLLNGFLIDMTSFSAKGNEQGGAAILPAKEVCLERYFGFRVEEGRAGFVAFSVADPDCVLSKVYIVNLQGTDFAHTGSGRIQEVNQRFFPKRFTGFPNSFKLNGVHRQTIRISDAERFHMSHGRFADDVLVDTPLKERIEDNPQVVQRAVANMMRGLIPGEEKTSVRSINMINRLLDLMEEVAKTGKIVLKGSFLQVLNGF